VNRGDLSLHYNKLRIVKKGFLLASILFCTTFLFAQRGWEAGVGLGVAHYFGDLNTDNEINSIGAAGTAFARYNFNNRLCWRMGLSFGQISGSDANSENNFENLRNLSFKSDIGEAAASLEFNFLPYNHGSRDKFYTPYLLAGFNVYLYDPEAELDGNVYKLRQLGTEGQFIGEEYNTIDMGLIYGGGIKLSLSFEWAIQVELTSRVLFTDYLDDVSTTYPDYDDLEGLRGDIAVALADRSVDLSSTPIGETGRQRGNSTNNDFYAFLTVSAVYYFGGIMCPSVTY